MSKIVCSNCGACLYECRRRDPAGVKRFWKHVARTACDHAVPVHRVSRRRCAKALAFGR